MTAYRVALALDGRFEVIRIAADDPEEVILSSHGTKAAAHEWLLDHMNLVNMADLKKWMRSHAR